MPYPGYGQATPEVLTQLDHQLQRERAWYMGAHRYNTNQEIDQAYLHGDLVKVHATDDLQPTGRFTNDADLYLPYLAPNAHRMLTDFGNLWRVTLWNSGIQDPSYRLAVTSMVRSQLYQDGLVRSTTLASPDSTHCTGNAVDIDAAGFYRRDYAGQVIAHGHSGRRENHRKISQKINRTPVELGHYDARITDAAIYIADLLHTAGLINRIHEFPDTPNACLHLAAVPDYPQTLDGQIDTKSLQLPDIRLTTPNHQLP